MKRFVASALLALPFAAASLPTQVFAANLIDRTPVQTQVSGREGTLKTPVSAPYSVGRRIWIRPVYRTLRNGRRIRIRAGRWVQVYIPDGHKHSTKDQEA
ncbi:hypothetical protein [Nostoc sp.]|uniref:hypothetical protein n=1 Tax=Nostoc sp. TaxID=1180 RepID=UPI002FFAE690